MTYVFSHGYLKRGGFPHSDICGSMLVCQLPAAFRRLPRPSSPVIAKASTTCTSSLDPISREPWAIRIDHVTPSGRVCATQATRLLSRVPWAKIHLNPLLVRSSSDPTNPYLPNC